MRQVLLVLVVLCLALAPAPPPRSRSRTNQADVKGQWVIESWVEHGRSEADVAKQYVVRLTKDRFEFDNVTGKGGMTFEMTLRPDLTPAGFSLHDTGHPGFFGSYRLEGDKMTLIFKSGGGMASRPTDFKGLPEVRFVMRRLRRD
jgi:uncharacterized protein (TIGR03067 family)